MRTENIDREKEKDQYLPLPLDDFSDARIAPTTNFLVTLTSTSVCGETTESAWRSKRDQKGELSMNARFFRRPGGALSTLRSLLRLWNNGSCWA